MIYFSPYMENLSSFEEDNHAIILNGYDMEIATDIEDNESMEEYGIVDIQYDHDNDSSILFFSEEMWNHLKEEYEFNKDED